MPKKKKKQNVSSPATPPQEHQITQAASSVPVLQASSVQAGTADEFDQLFAACDEFTDKDEKREQALAALCEMVSQDQNKPHISEETKHSVNYLKEHAPLRRLLDWPALLVLADNELKPILACGEDVVPWNPFNIQIVTDKLSALRHLKRHQEVVQTADLLVKGYSISKVFLSTTLITERLQE